MSRYNFKQKDLVAFDYSGVEGYGEVMGVATTELPILGCYYMVHVRTSNKNLPTEEYPFTTISIPEIGMLKLSLDYTKHMVDDVATHTVKLGDHPVCYLKSEYMFAVQAMPEPERSNHVKRWADEIFDSAGLPSRITRPLLHQFMRYITGCK